MCGRFGFRGTAEQFQTAFGYLPRPEQLRNYNIAPTHSVMYVTKDTHGQAHWGLIPRTATETTFAPSNAMAETIATKYPFKIPFKEGQTCIIPASHLYDEWS